MMGNSWDLFLNRKSACETLTFTLMSNGIRTNYPSPRVALNNPIHRCDKLNQTVGLSMKTFSIFLIAYVIPLLCSYQWAVDKTVTSLIFIRIVAVSN